MGTWGVGIWSNDLACDLREDFRELIADGLTAQEATARLVAEYEFDADDPESNDFWLGLAAAQHRSGHLADGVQERALAVIDDQSDLRRWEARDRGKRAAVLEKLRATLAGPPPAPRKVRPRKKADTALVEGNHVVFPGPDGAPGILLRVTGLQQDKGGRYAAAVAVEWNGDERLLPRAHRLPAHLDPRPTREYEANGFLLIGVPGDPPELRVLPVMTDDGTPSHVWQTLRMVTWAQLRQRFDQNGAPQA